MLLVRACHDGTPWRYNMQKKRLQSMQYEAIGSKKGAAVTVQKAPLRLSSLIASLALAFMQV